MTSRARILFLDHTAELGGAELSMLDIAKFFSPASTVILFSEGPLFQLLKNEGVPVYIVSAGKRLHKIRKDTSGIAAMKIIPEIVFLALKIAAKAKNYDIIYANTIKSFIVASLIGIFVRRPIVWHLHDVLIPENFGSYTRKIVVFLANLRAKKIIANSIATKEAFVNAGGYGDKVSVVYNSIDPSQFDHFDKTDIARLKLSIIPHEKCFLVGMFGRLAPWKGQHIFLESLSDMPGVYGVIVGGSLFGESDYEKKLKQLIQDYGLESRVKMLGHRTDIPNLMAATDLIVHASTTPEPFGRVVVEAMMAEKPIIATRAGGVLEIIKDKETGLLVSPGSSAELAAAIRYLRHNSSIRTAMASRGRYDAVCRFSPDNILNRIYRIVSCLI